MAVQKSSQHGDFQRWKRLVWTTRAWHRVPGRKCQAPTWRKLGCFTGCVHWASGTEHANIQSENIYGPRPRKAFWRLQRDSPELGPSKERPHVLSCCEAHSAWMHHTLPECNHNRSCKMAADWTKHATFCTSRIEESTYHQLWSPNTGRASAKYQARNPLELEPTVCTGLLSRCRDPDLMPGCANFREEVAHISTEANLTDTGLGS